MGSPPHRLRIDAKVPVKIEDNEVGQVSVSDLLRPARARMILARRESFRYVEKKRRMTLMKRIVLNDEQMKVLAEAQNQVEVRDSGGHFVGFLRLVEITPAEIEEAKRRLASPGPWYTGEQVQARLQALEQEWDRTGGFDEAYMHEFLKRLDAADPGHMRSDGQSK
jgi:hypothetical protein